MAFRTEQEVDSLHATIECEQPQPDLYKWVRRRRHWCVHICISPHPPPELIHHAASSSSCRRFVGRINIYKDNEEPVARCVNVCLFM